MDQLPSCQVYDSLRELDKVTPCHKMVPEVLQTTLRGWVDKKWGHYWKTFTTGTLDFCQVMSELISHFSHWLVLHFLLWTTANKKENWALMLQVGTDQAMLQLQALEQKTRGKHVDNP